VTITFFLEEYN